MKLNKEKKQYIKLIVDVTFKDRTGVVLRHFPVGTVLEHSGGTGDYYVTGMGGIWKHEAVEIFLPSELKSFKVLRAEKTYTEIVVRASTEAEAIEMVEKNKFHERDVWAKWFYGYSVESCKEI